MPGIGNTILSRCERRCPEMRLSVGIGIPGVVLLVVLEVGGGVSPLIITVKLKFKAYLTAFA